MSSVFKIGEELKNDTCYIADKKRYDIYLKDTTHFNNRRYSAAEIDVFIALKDKKNITIDFCGATLMLHGPIQPFIIDGCCNIKIKNCIIEYDVPMFIEGEMTEVGEDYVVWDINKEKYPYAINDGYMTVKTEEFECNHMNKIPMWFQTFDARTREGTSLKVATVGRKISYPEDCFCPPEQYIPYEVDGKSVLKGKIPPFWKAGDILVIVFSNRTLSSAFIVDSKNTYIENYRIMNGSGMGIFIYHSENTYMERLILTRDDCSDGIVTNAADAVHAIGAFGEFVMKDCILEGMIDDALNIHSHFYTVKECRGNVLVAKKKAHAQEICNEIDKGEEIAVYRENTMEVTAKYIVEKSELKENGDLVLELDRPLLKHNEGDLIENLTTQANVLIQNCKIRKSNTHLRFQSRSKIVVEDSVIGLPVLITGDASYWFESSPVNDMTIRNCEFSHEKARIRLMPEIMPTKKEPYYHKNLKLTNNTFISENPITGGYTDNIEFLGNKNINDKEMVLTLTNCGKVTADNCRIERKTEVKTELKKN